MGLVVRDYLEDLEYTFEYEAMVVAIEWSDTWMEKKGLNNAVWDIERGLLLKLGEGNAVT